MSKLSPSELIVLYDNFIKYRESECNGFARLSINEYFRKYGLNKQVA